MSTCSVCAAPIRPDTKSGFCVAHRWEPYKRRNRQMAAAYKAGEAIDSIAARHGLQRETIRLVLREQGCLITPSEPPAPRRYALRDIIHHTSVVFGYTVDEIKSKDRHRYLVRPRQCITLLARRLCPHLTLPQIGRALNRDHTTVIHQYETGCTLLGTDDTFRTKVLAVVAALQPVGHKPHPPITPKPAPIKRPAPPPEPMPEGEWNEIDALSWAVRKYKAQEMAA